MEDFKNAVVLDCRKTLWKYGQLGLERGGTIYIDEDKVIDIFNKMAAEIERLDAIVSNKAE